MIVGMNQKQRFMGTLQGYGADRFPFFDLERDEEAINANDTTNGVKPVKKND